LTDYNQFQKDLRSYRGEHSWETVSGTYTCWDNLEHLMEYYVENPASDDHMHCYKIGMWRDYENGRDVYGTFATTLSTLGESLPFEWHESLAYSAAKSLKQV